MLVDVSLLCFVFILSSFCALKGEEAQVPLFNKRSQCFYTVVREKNSKKKTKDKEKRELFPQSMRTCINI